MKQTKPTIRDFRSALSDGFFTRLKEKSKFIFWEEECRSGESTCPLLRELIRMKVIFILRQGKKKKFANIFNLHEGLHCCPLNAASSKRL